jgi:hypothetical protein
MGAPPSYVAPAAPRRTVPALDRPLLPDGRMPRGGFIWSRAASFTPQVGDWTPSASVSAASSGGEAAAAGVPAWGGMTPVELPAVQAALADSSSPVVAGTRRSAAGRPLVGPSPRPEVSAAAQLLGEEGAPLLRLVTAAAGGSPISSRANPPDWVPQLVQPPPPVPSAPSSESSARMLEALRSQVQSSATDDRVTLADLTLVAAASSSRQMAASAAPAAGSSTPTQGQQSTAGGHGAKAEKKSPEAERREIEEIARHVLDEVERMCEIARERNGDPWEA